MEHQYLVSYRNPYNKESGTVPTRWGVKDGKVYRWMLGKGEWLEAGSVLGSARDSIVAYAMKRYGWTTQSWVVLTPATPPKPGKPKSKPAPEGTQLLLQD